MKCGNCDKTDGMCYTSTGKFHGYGDDCDAYKNLNPTLTTPTLATHCIVCDDTIGLTAEEEIALYTGHHIHSKVCDKCKQAIMRVRKDIESEEKAAIDRLRLAQTIEEKFRAILKQIN